MRFPRALQPESSSPRKVAKEFRALLAAGARIRCAGRAHSDPEILIGRGYLPRYRIDLFGNQFYLGRQRYDDDIGYIVAFVRLASRPGDLYARIFYKDLSLIWRCATHLVCTPTGRWIGKGAVDVEIRDGMETLSSAEHTTDLPLEMQAAVSQVSRADGNAVRDVGGVALVLRNAPSNRLRAYQDFQAPLDAAQADRTQLINGGRRVARFTRRNDPASLRFARGYAPDFEHGVLELGTSASRFYGGAVRSFRIRSENARIQYLFVEAPDHCWIIPPQAMSETLSTYGVRTVRVYADDELFVPGFEYHYVDEDVDPPLLYSQIPEGYAGSANAFDDTRADASAWLNALPVIKQFKSALGR